MSELFSRVLSHLLPSSRSFRVIFNKKLTLFLRGLTSFGAPLKEFLDEIFLEVSPSSTRSVALWEEHFGITGTGLSEGERRSRLSAAWKALGGQSLTYIQETLNDAGFNVFIHEWWEPGTEPAVGVMAGAMARNPILYLRREYASLILLVECGEQLAACGEEFAVCGNSVEPLGYPLVNKVFETKPNYLNLCGEEFAVCGEETAACNYFLGFKEGLKPYTLPYDNSTWPYFLYIGGEVFGTLARVPISRKNEFEELCLKICPAQQWLGILVEYN